MDDGAAFEIRRGVKMYSAHQQGSGQKGMQSQKIIVVAIPDKVRIKIPGPRYSRVTPLAFERGAMEEFGLCGNIRHGKQGGPPPVGYGYVDTVIIDVLVPMRGEDVLVVVGIKLHENRDLPEIIETGDPVGLIFGLGQRG